MYSFALVLLRSVQYPPLLSLGAAHFSRYYITLPLPKRNLPRSSSAGLRINKFHRAHSPRQNVIHRVVKPTDARPRRLLMFHGKSHLSGSLLHFAASLSTFPEGAPASRLWHRYSHACKLFENTSNQGEKYIPTVFQVRDEIKRGFKN